jgi:hypothetical protein
MRQTAVGAWRWKCRICGVSIEALFDSVEILDDCRATLLRPQATNDHNGRAKWEAKRRESYFSQGAA